MKTILEITDTLKEVDEEMRSLAHKEGCIPLTSSPRVKLMQARIDLLEIHEFLKKKKIVDKKSGIPI